MKTITKAQYDLQVRRNCGKGKHRPYENRMGVTWCTTCGSLMKSCVSTDPETHQPVNNYEPIIIQYIMSVTTDVFTVECPYCKEKVTYTGIEHVSYVLEHAFLQCPSCRKMVEVTEEMDSIKYALTPAGLFASILMDHFPSIKEEELIDNAHAAFQDLMETLTKEGILIKE